MYLPPQDNDCKSAQLLIKEKKFQYRNRKTAHSQRANLRLGCELFTTGLAPSSPGTRCSAWPKSRLPVAFAASPPGSSRRRHTRLPGCASERHQSSSTANGRYWSYRRETLWCKSWLPCLPDPPWDPRPPSFLLPACGRWSSSVLHAAQAVSSCNNRVVSCPCKSRPSACYLGPSKNSVV